MNVKHFVWIVKRQKLDGRFSACPEGFFLAANVFKDAVRRGETCALFTDAKEADAYKKRLNEGAA